MSERETRFFQLPVPPVPSQLRGGWQKKLRIQHEYMTSVFREAAQYQAPMLHPPEQVQIKARFYLRNLRDEDNLLASMKWVLDAMKKVQPARSTLRWKGHIDRAWFHDDDPAHLTLECEQEIDRKDPRLVLIITTGGET